jgi:hypothetical protein
MRYFALIGIVSVLVILMVGAQAQDQQSPLNDKEQQLANLVNQYRVDNHLSAVPITNSLTEVARLHIIDLNTYHPDTETYEVGDCNKHSWSNQGDWTAVCYNDSNTAMHSLSRSKPREITDGIYEGDGYEISAYNSQEITPEIAFNTWRTSTEGHNDVMLNLNQWADHPWEAMGVGIDGNYAVVWFGEEQDPAGPVGCTASYCTNLNVLHKCDNNIETIVPQGCFLGLFGPPNEQFRVGNGSKAFADIYYAEFNVDVLGGTDQDPPKLIILIDKTLNGGVNPRGDSQFKINDKPARKLNDFFNKTDDEGKDKFLYKLEVSDLQIGTNTLRINPKGDDFAIYKIWIENAKGERIWKVKDEQCLSQSECKFDDRYNPYQLACDFTASPHVCKEKKARSGSCKKNFECVSGTCSANSCA